MAKSPKFINFSELSDELKHFIQMGAKIFPINTYEDIPNHKTHDFLRVLEGDYKNHIFAWSDEDGQYNLIGADDKYISWDDIESKPNTFPPSEHTHDELHTHNNKSILDSITESLINAWNSAVNHISDATKHVTLSDRNLWDTVVNKVTKIDGKQLSTNDYTDEDKIKLDSLTENAEFDYNDMLFALEDHTHSGDHDNRYYTQAQVDMMVSNKAELSVVSGHISNSTIHVTSLDKDKWDAKSDFSGDYNDLSNKPAIPIKISQLENDSNFETVLGSQDKANQAEQNAKDYTDDKINNITGVEVYTSPPSDLKSGQVFFLEV